MTGLAAFRRALDRLPPGAEIIAGAHCGTPTTLLEKVSEVAALERRWRLQSGLLFGADEVFGSVTEGRLGYRTWHVGPQTSGLIESGSASFVPLRGRDLPRYLTLLGPAMALVKVTPPDRHGYVSLGTSASYTVDLLRTASVIVAEVDPNLPFTMGRTSVPSSMIDVLVEAEHPIAEYVARAPSDVSRRIAEHVAGCIPRNPILQMGIGQVPEAITSLLSRDTVGEVRFVGMGSDHMIDLFDTGVLRRDSVVPDPAIAAVELLGTERLFSAAHLNPSIGVYPVTAAGDPAILAALPRTVSINSAVEIDLMGQCNVEFAAGRQVAGVGGSLDFIDAARASEGGLSIIALPSRSNGKGRIVSQLAPSTPVSIPRHSMHVVATEFGIADLRCRSLGERAEALIAIAHPDDRDGLANGLLSIGSIR